MSSPLLARQGRHLQRYDKQLRLVAGYLFLLLPTLLTFQCIPYKINGNSSNQSGDLMNRVEVLMISSPGRHDLIFPKVRTA
ncbi:hypothetical protein B296_00054103 [Ensete ventricosum]|uniref:Uncharacterized protein n=1 Tax=Ensete ventricosum TaxID=4639 RepID=A0A426XZQ6_ENSVE|nr:hypothetical protein B296_00054103 [Ensete ventricosum]